MLLKKYPIADINFIGNEETYVHDAIKSNWISSKGKYIDDFEFSFSKYLDVKHSITTSNGTTAIHLALESLGIGYGDEVIVPSLTFAATANAVIHSGASPVFVDSMNNHWNLDYDKISQAITKKTKAIIPVHLYGHPCDMLNIMNVARKYKLFVIEDCAEAPGAIVDGKKVGSIGDIGCFSFFGNKILTTGEGGMCVTNDSNLNEKMRILRDHGMDKSKKYWHNEVGYNYRMTNLNAAIGLAQLEQVDNFLRKRLELKKEYDNTIDFNYKLLKPMKNIYGKNVEWMYCLNFKKEFINIRDYLITELKKKNIETRPFFYPLHLMKPYFKYINENDLFYNAENFGLSGINLPLYPLLEKKDVKYISNIVNNILLVNEVS